MQLTHYGLIALSAAALLLPEENRKSSSGTQDATEAVAPTVEIRLGIGRFFVQVAAGLARSADECTPQRISAAGISNEQAVAVAGSRESASRSGSSAGPAMLTGARVQPLVFGATSRRITRCLANNQGGVS